MGHQYVNSETKMKIGNIMAAADENEKRSKSAAAQSKRKIMAIERRRMAA